MNRFLLLIAVMVATTGLASAQQAAVAPKAVVQAVSNVISTSGKVSSVAEADAAKGVKASIAIVIADNSAKTFAVGQATTIYGVDGKALTLKDIKVGDMVKVNAKASNEAVAIYVTK